MNTLIFRSIFGIMFCCLFVITTNAQVTDDLYYTPNTVDYTEVDNAVEETAAVDVVNDDTQFYAADVSDYDQAYEDDYYYQSRLRRFCNPYSGLSYYAPAYTNSYYYNNSPFAWSNNIYYQPVYSQNWWNNSRSYNNFYGSNYNFSNYNYVTNNNFAPYTSFGSSVYNNTGFYNYNTGGIYQNNPYNNPCTINNYVANTVDNYNARSNNKPAASTRSDRERPTSYRSPDGDTNKRTTGVRRPTTTKNNSGYTRTNTTKNTSTPAPKPRYRSNENATKDNTAKPKSQNRSSNFFNSLKNLGKTSSNGESTKSNNSNTRSSGKSYRSNNSSSRSYGSSTRSSSRSSGSRSTGRSSRSGGRN